MIARVQLWGRTIGAVSMDDGRDYAAFQYDPAFATSGIQLSPLVMPLSDRVYEFPDVIYSHNPAGAWTASHQMTVNGKRDGFTIKDLEACARSSLLKRGRCAAILEEVLVAVKRWPEFAAVAKVPAPVMAEIRRNHRLKLATR